MVFVLVVLTQYIYSQSANEKELELKAIQLFKQKKFVEAQPLFSQLLSLYPKDERYNFYYGACLIENNENIEKAIKYLEFADSKLNDPIIKYYIGRANHLLYQFDTAIKFYEDFKQQAQSKLIKEYQVERLIAMCNNGKQLLNYLSDLTVVDNRRIKAENYFYSYDLKEFDGKLIIKPKELKTSIDKKLEQPNIVIFLPNNSKTIYYGSYGNSIEFGRDIYKTEIMPDGTFSKPERLPNIINTEYDEDFPFFFSNNNTLFFSSKGHNSMGGYDIFYSVFDTTKNQWQPPVNLDFPINTPYDDFLYIVDKNQFYAYFTSNRETRNNNITVYKIIVDKNPIRREVKNIEEIQTISRLEVSPIEKIKQAEEKKQKEREIIYNEKQPFIEQKLTTSTLMQSEQNYILPDITKFKPEPITFNPKLKPLDIIDNIKKDIEAVQKNKEEIEHQSLVAYEMAKNKNDEANRLRQQAFNLNNQANKIKDPVESEKLKYQAYEIINKAENLEKDAITLLNLAKKFEEVSKEMEKDISKVKAFASALSQQNNVDEAIIEATNSNKARLEKSQNKYTSILYEYNQREKLIEQKINDLKKNEYLLSQINDSLNLYYTDSNTKDKLEFRKNALEELIQKQRQDIEDLKQERQQLTEFAQLVKSDSRTPKEFSYIEKEKSKLIAELTEKEKQLTFSKAESIKKQIEYNKPEESSELILQSNAIPNEHYSAKDDQQKAINPILPVLNNTQDNIDELNYQKVYYTNIIKEQENKLSTLNKQLEYTNDNEEKETLNKYISNLQQEIDNNKQRLEEINKKLAEIKEKIDFQTNQELPTNNENIILARVKYQNKYPLNLTLQQQQLLSEANQLRDETYESELKDKIEKLNHLKSFKENEKNSSEIKRLENEIKNVSTEFNKSFSEYFNKVNKAADNNYKVYNEILTNVRNYDFSKEQVKNANILEKEIEALKEKSNKFKTLALSSNDPEEKLSLLKKACFYDNIITEKQKYAIDLYIESRQETSSEPDAVKNVIELTPEENKQLILAQREKDKVEDKYQKNIKLINTLTEKYKEIENSYSPTQKKELAKEIAKTEKHVEKEITEILNVYDKNNKITYELYNRKITELIQNQNIDYEKKAIARQFLKESEFYYNEANNLKQQLTTYQTPKDKILTSKKILDLQQKALDNQNYAIDALTNTNSEIFIVTNTLVKVDRLEALDKKVYTEDVIKVRTNRILEHLNLSEKELKQLDEANKATKTLNDINNVSESYKKKVLMLKESLKHAKDDKEKEKINKQIKKEENEWFKYEYTKAEVSEKINDAYYNIYESNLSKIRPNNKDEETLKAIQFEKDAQKDYYKAKSLRDKAYITNNAYLAYNYLLEADSLEKEAITKQEKAYTIYLKLKPLEEEVAEYKEKKKSVIDEQLVITNKANITPIETKYEEEIIADNKIVDTYQNINTNDYTPTKTTQYNEINKKQELELPDKKENNENFKNIVIEKQIETETNQNNNIQANEIKIKTEEVINNQISETNSQLTLNTTTSPILKSKETKEAKTNAISKLPIPIPTQTSIPMGFAFYKSSPYSETNPIPINAPLPEGLVFKVQIGAFYRPVKDNVFRGIYPVTAEKLPESRFYRYFVGLFYSEEAAAMVRDYIKPLGFPDAFIVAFYNGKRIPLYEARKILKTSTSPEYERILTAEKEKIKTVTSIPQIEVTSEKSDQQTVIQEKASSYSISIPKINSVTNLFYSVQIGVFKTPVSKEYYDAISPVYIDEAYGYIRYLVGRFNNRFEANKVKDNLVNNGYTDAFVVAYFKGKRISVSEAATIETMNPSVLLKNSENISVSKSTTNNFSVDEYNDIDINNLHYKIQIGVFKDAVPANIASKFPEISNKYGLDKSTDENNFTTYFAGYFKTFNDAQNCKNELIKLGFTDAFIIAYDGKKRVPVNIAQKILK
ncbi:MAG: hypothetical protein N3A01_04550 [Bacteroidales bacterium]|nr:hypothetical protein [Bacteroidales bacterium]